MKNQKNKTTAKTKGTIAKTKQKTKEIHKDKKKKKKRDQLHFSERFFTCILPVSLSNTLGHNPFTLSVKCHFFPKAVAFIELFRAISFCILLTFRISAIRLFIFMNLFSLDF